MLIFFVVLLLDFAIEWSYIIPISSPYDKRKVINVKVENWGFLAIKDRYKLPSHLSKEVRGQLHPEVG